MKFVTRGWRDDNATVQRSTYGADGSVKLTIKGRYGQVLCDATVCLSDRNHHPARGNVFIKDWGDNEGVLRILQSAGIIGGTVRTVPSGVAQPAPVMVNDGTLRIEYPVHECPLL